MGAIADFLSAAVTIDTTPPTDPLDRRVYRELKAIQDGDAGGFDVPSNLQAADEVQSIAIYVGTVSGGTFTLQFVLAGGKTFTTANIAFDANAATIEGAIDTAATAAGVVGWTNGDITVAGGPLTTTPVTLTFDGASVDEANHGLVVMDDALLTGGGSGGAITTTAEGQAARLGYAILRQLGILSGTVPAEGVVPSALVVGASVSERRISGATVRAIALEIAIAEGNDDIYAALVAAAHV
jgi:hypothetical protein